MTVITLARQVGSGGHAVAQTLSERLGLRVVGRRELRDEAAKRGLSLPESFVRFASEDGNARSQQYLAYSELEFDLALRGGPHFSPSDITTGFLADISAQRREILLTLQLLIYDFAAQDNVILVGAGAQILLAELPHVLRVKFIAPAETRVERMVSAYSLTEGEARTAVVAGDQEQLDYNRVIFGEDWNNPELWDLVINSALLTVEQMASVIASIAATTAPISEIAIQLVRAAAINRALLDAPELASTFVCATPSPDVIEIRGEAPDDDTRQEVEVIVERIAAGSAVKYALTNPSLH